MRRRAAVTPVGTGAADPSARGASWTKRKKRGTQQWIWSARAFSGILFVWTLYRLSFREVDPDLLQFSEEEEKNSMLVLPRLKPNELAPIVWRSDNKRADTYGRLVGLPPKLTQEIRLFCDESGLLDLFWSLAYSGEPVIPDHSVIHTLRGGRKWASMTTASDAHWHGSNMHWLDAADEENYEETLKVLERGGFDTVLDAIGKEFNSTGLMVAGTYNSLAMS